ALAEVAAVHQLLADGARQVLDARILRRRERIALIQAVGELDPPLEDRAQGPVVEPLPAAARAFVHATMALGGDADEAGAASRAGQLARLRHGLQAELQAAGCAMHRGRQVHVEALRAAARLHRGLAIRAGARVLGEVAPAIRTP